MCPKYIFKDKETHTIKRKFYNKNKRITEVHIVRLLELKVCIYLLKTIVNFHNVYLLPFIKKYPQFKKQKQNLIIYIILFYSLNS